MGGFIVNLLAEKIGHGGRIFVQVDALSPTAVDVVHEPLEGPQTTEKPKTLIVPELAPARGIRHRVHGRDHSVPARSGDGDPSPERFQGLSEKILIGGI
jgi:hypothetical protein